MMQFPRGDLLSNVKKSICSILRMICLFVWFLPQDKAVRPLNLAGHVGFDSLPDQLVNKSICQGFCFNILCIGKFTILHTNIHAQCDILRMKLPLNFCVIS